LVVAAMPVVWIAPGSIAVSIANTLNSSRVIRVTTALGDADGTIAMVHPSNARTINIFRVILSTPSEMGRKIACQAL
jgi:hypothetical protein